MNLIRLSTAAVVVFWLMIIACSYGCSRQFAAPAWPPNQFPLALQAPIGSAYPGTRELMDAPSNDPALNNDRNGVELRP
jgi:hypothetical protein